MIKSKGIDGSSSIPLFRSFFISSLREIAVKSPDIDKEFSRLYFPVLRMAVRCLPKADNQLFPSKSEQLFPVH